MTRDSKGDQATALVVAVGECKNRAYERLELSPQAARKLAQALVAGGYRHDYPALVKGGRTGDIVPLVRQWFLNASPDDVLFFFWTGHGKSEAEGHYLIAEESPGTDLDETVALAATTPHSSLGGQTPNEFAHGLTL